MENSTVKSYSSKISNSFNKAFDRVKSIDTGKLIKNINENMIVIMVNILLVIAIALMIWNYSYNRTLEKTLCDDMLAMYPEPNGMIASIKNVKNVSKDATNNFTYPLHDYYISTAYNACSPGNYKNTAVSTCALKDVISQGVRCFDFEIYSLDNKPIIATSMDKSFHVKETFNYVPFGDAMTVLRDFGRSGTGAPNPNDPMFIHLRIQSDNPKMFLSLAQILKSMQKDKQILPPGASIAHYDQNFSKIPLLMLTKPPGGAFPPIIVIVDKTNPAWLQSQELRECVNMVSNSVFMRCLRYTKDVKQTPDMEELKEYNKLNMTIVLPDDKNNPDNPGAMFSRSVGCQMVAMRYQTPDPQLKENADYFSNQGHAFVLKPPELRYIQEYIKKPPPPDKKLSYESRELKDKQGLYDFDV